MAEHKNSGREMILQVFKEGIRKNENIFVPFLTIGDPNPEVFMEIVDKLIPNADIIELGIPFSDPLADGPIIQSGNVRALENGSTLSSSIQLLTKIRNKTDKPITLLTYTNILGFGEERINIIKQFRDAGVSAMVIADLPIEESLSFQADLNSYNIALIYLVSPTTTADRLKKILEHAEGYLYLVSVIATTGIKSDILEQSQKNVETVIGKIRNDFHSEIPVLVGFGISTPSDIQGMVQAGANGVIVGSAIVREIEKNLEKKSEIPQYVASYVKMMKDSTKRG